MAPRPEPTPAALAAMSAPRPKPRHTPEVADTPFGTVSDGQGGSWARCSSECELGVRPSGSPSCRRCEHLEAETFVELATARGACPRCTRQLRAVFHRVCPYV